MVGRHDRGMVFAKQNAWYGARAQDSTIFQIVLDLFASGIKAISTGKPVRNTKIGLGATGRRLSI